MDKEKTPPSADAGLKAEVRQETGQVAYLEAERIHLAFRNKGIEGYSIEPAYQSDLTVTHSHVSDAVQNSLKSEFEKSGIKVLVVDTDLSADISFIPGTTFPDKLSFQVNASVSVTDLCITLPKKYDYIIAQPFSKHYGGSFSEDDEVAQKMKQTLEELGYVNDSDLF